MKLLEIKSILTKGIYDDETYNEVKANDTDRSTQIRLMRWNQENLKKENLPELKNYIGKEVTITLSVDSTQDCKDVDEKKPLLENTDIIYSNNLKNISNKAKRRLHQEELDKWLKWIYNHAERTGLTSFYSSNTLMSDYVKKDLEQRGFLVSRGFFSKERITIYWDLDERNSQFDGHE